MDVKVDVAVDEDDRYAWNRAISSLIFAISASCNIKSRRINSGNGAVPSMWQHTHVIIHRKGAGTRFGHGLGKPGKYEMAIFRESKLNFKTMNSQQSE